MKKSFSERLLDAINTLTMLYGESLEHTEQPHPKPKLIKSGNWRDTEYIENRIAQFETKSISKQIKSTDINATNKFKENKEIMSPKYADGSFRTKGKQLEYRFMHNGKQEYVYGANKTICWQKRTDLIAGKSHKKNKNHAALTFDSWIWKWYTLFKQTNQSNKSQAEAKRRISKLVDNFGQTQLAKISSEDIQEYLNKFKHIPAEQEKLTTILKSCFQKAVILRHIKYNPCDALEIKRHKNKHYPVIQLADQRKIFEIETDNLYKKIFMIYCCTGLRLSELLNALPHIDFKKHIFNIVEKDTDTKKHSRKLPFLPELLNEKDRDQILKMKSYNIQSHFKKLFKKHNINAVVHSFRVTFISCCNHININPKQIQEWAGHAKIEMTMDTYAKLLINDGTSPILEYLKKLKNELKL